MITTCTSSTEASLISLSAYKTAAGITSSTDDTLLTSLLQRATGMLEGYLGYPLMRGVYSETVPAYGSQELRVSRTPVTAVTAVYYTSDLVDPTSYTVENPGAGIIYRELGWPWTAGLEYDLTPHVTPQSELRSFRVEYEAGYCQAGSTYASTDGWLTTGTAVPFELEQACVQATNFLYRSGGRDPSVTSKRIGDLSITYESGNADGSGLPFSVKGQVAHLRRF